MTPKKILIIGGCVLVIGAIGGMLNPKLAPQPKTQKQEAIQVGVKAGIGDTESRWEKDYGNLADQDMIKNVTINGSHVTAVFADDKALNITIEKRDKYYKNSAIDDMLPSDRTEIEKVKDKSDPAVIKDLITYHSDILEKAIPDTRGNFTVIDASDGLTQAYINTVIDCTPEFKQ